MQNDGELPVMVRSNVVMVQLASIEFQPHQQAIGHVDLAVVPLPAVPVGPPSSVQTGQGDHQEDVKENGRGSRFGGG